MLVDQALGPEVADVEQRIIRNDARLAVLISPHGVLLRAQTLQLVKCH